MAKKHTLRRPSKATTRRVVARLRKKAKPASTYREVYAEACRMDLPKPAKAIEVRVAMYRKAAVAAVNNGETDKMIRALMAAALDYGSGHQDVLSQDLTLLRWVLRKMEENRKAQSALDQEFNSIQEELEEPAW